MKTKLLFLAFLFPILGFSQTLKGSLITGISSTASARASVALSSNGNILIASAPYNGGGTAKIFEFQNNDWTQLGGDFYFPYSVAISSDGTIIAGGSIKAGNLDNGAIAIYKYVNNNWVIVGGSINGEANFDEFGYQVALSSDGSIVAASAIFNDVNGSKSGHVRIFKNVNDVWTQIGSDIDGDAENDRFGSQIALSNDGSIIAISSPYNDTNGNDAGQVKVFKNVNDVWTQIGNDILGDAAGNRFGKGVSMSADGNSVVITAPSSTGSNCIVYKNINDVWNQKGSTITGALGDVSMSADGKFLFLEQQYSHIHLYEYKNNDWVDIGTVTTTRASSSFCSSKDASTVAIGLNSNYAPVEVYDVTGITLGVEDFINSSIKMFPNPVKDELTIHLTNGLTLKNVFIYNLLGKKVVTSNQSTITVNTLHKGVYFIEIHTDKGKLVKKIIIE